MGFRSSRAPSAGPREMFPAVCSDCGQQTTVPFQPTEGRPVYCRDCFAKRNPRSDRGGGFGGRR
ncbi:MAG: CxxC-x17-CxxC domain-containing protein [Thermoplasmatota archaeon]